MQEEMVRNGRLVSLPFHGPNRVAADPHTPLWQLDLIDRESGTPLIVSPRSNLVTHEKPLDGNPGGCRYAVEKDGKPLAVFDAWTERDGDAVLFQGALEQLDSGYRVERLRYPIIPLAPIERDPQADTLLMSYMYGQFIESPRTKPAERMVRKQGELEDAIAWGHYPSKWGSLQMSFYFGSTGGLLLWTPDPRRTIKDFVYDRPDEVLRASVLHYMAVDRMQQGRFEIPYPVRVDWVDGTWYDAAQVYREWAMQQKWSVEPGPMETRSDLPTWFRDLPSWTRTPKDPHVAWDDMTSWPLQWAEAVGGPQGVHFYGWNDICGPRNSLYPIHEPPREEYAEAVERFHKAGLYVFPYTNSRIASLENPEWDSMKDDMVRTPSGDYCGREQWAEHVTPEEFEEAKRQGKNVRDRNYAEQPCHMVFSEFTPGCPKAAGWQERMVTKTMERFRQDNADGVYEDQVGAWPLFCYADNHDHAPGDPDAWVDGTREIYERIRAEMKKDGSYGPLFSEYLAEDLVPLIDGGLTITPPLLMHDPPVPLFPAIYHTHFAAIGWAEDTPRYLEENANHYLQQRMMPLVFGSQLGWLSYTIPTLIKDYPWMVDCYRDMVTLRKQFPAMLCYGKMLRPPRVEGVPQLRAPAPNPKRGVRTQTWPAILSGYFREGMDGPRALAVCGNWTESEQTGTLHLDLSELTPPLTAQFTDGTDIGRLDGAEAEIELRMLPATVTGIVLNTGERETNA